MTGSSFHWFVAWRYLMARPRRVSPAAFLVAGALLILSTASSLIGNLVFRPTPERVFVTIGAHELMLCLAIALLAQAGLLVLWGLFRYCQRQPGQVGVPCATVAALVAGSIAALTMGAPDEGSTRTVGMVLGALGGVAMLPVLVRYWRNDRAGAVTSLACAAVLGLAAYATLALARGFFAQEVPFPPDAVLVRGFGLWTLGMLVAEVAVATQVLRGRASRWALAALLVLGACAVYARWSNAPAEAQAAPAATAAPAAATADFGELADSIDALDDLPDAAPEHLADPSFDPFESQDVLRPYTALLIAGGSGLCGLGLILGLITVVMRVLERLYGHARSGHFFVLGAVGVTSGLTALAATFIELSAFLLIVGQVLLSLGALFVLVGVVLLALEALRVHVRSGIRMFQIASACFAMGASVLVLGAIVANGSESYLVFSARQAPQQPFLLLGVGLLALGWLTGVLGAIRYVFTFFTTVSVAGVTIGSMALVIVLSVMSGFESDLRNKILGSNAHVLITKEEGPFTEYREIAARIAGIPGVVAQTPYLTSEVVIAANSNYANVIIKGVDPDTVGSVTELGKNTQQPRALERLYPLADDGSIIGPPHDAGAGQEPGPAPKPNTPDGTPDGTEDDPPPPDMQLGWGEPQDFSGGTAPEEPGPADAEPAEREPGAGTGKDRNTGTDPPPADMQLDWDAPQDFSGGATAAGSSDRAGERPRGAGGKLPGNLPGDLPEDLLDLDGEMLDLGEPGEPVGDQQGERAGEGGGSSSKSSSKSPSKSPSGKRTAGRVRWDDALLGDDDTVSEIRVSARVARLPGVLVGKELVKNLHLYVGQEVRIISPLAEDTPAGPVPRTRYLRVAGSFFTGMYEYDFKFVYVALSTLQEFLDLPGEVSGIEIRVADPVETGPVLRDLRAALPPGYRVQDWQEINRNLFSALKLEKIAMFLILAIIILVASFSIISNLIMVVVEKAKEIALLKTLGATDASVVSIFVTQGFFLGVVGTLVGVAHGLVACYLGNLYGVPLNPEVYYIDRLPIHVEELAVSAVALAGVAISVLATLYPAAMAARLQPMEGLRYD